MDYSVYRLARLIGSVNFSKYESEDGPIYWFDVYPTPPEVRLRDLTKAQRVAHNVVHLWSPTLVYNLQPLKPLIRTVDAYLTNKYDLEGDLIVEATVIDLVPALAYGHHPFLFTLCPAVHIKPIMDRDRRKFGAEIDVLAKWRLWVPDEFVDKVANHIEEKGNLLYDENMQRLGASLAVSFADNIDSEGAEMLAQSPLSMMPPMQQLIYGIPQIEFRFDIEDLVIIVFYE